MFGCWRGCSHIATAGVKKKNSIDVLGVHYVVLDDGLDAAAPLVARSSLSTPCGQLAAAAVAGVAAAAECRRRRVVLGKLRVGLFLQ